MHSKYSHPKPRQVRVMSNIEAAYVGAMLDGEGTVGKRGEISITNTELEIISALIRCTGIGSVYLKVANGLGTKVAWTWSAHRMDDIIGLATQLIPYSIKAQKALKHPTIVLRLAEGAFNANNS